MVRVSSGVPVTVQCRHSIPALNVWTMGMKYDHTPDWHRCMDDLITGRGFDSQATHVNDVLGLLFYMLSTSVFRPDADSCPIMKNLWHENFIFMYGKYELSVHENEA